MHKSQIVSIIYYALLFIFFTLFTTNVYRLKYSKTGTMPLDFESAFEKLTTYIDYIEI